MATARTIYFFGALELTSIQPMDNKPFAEKWPGVKGKRYDSFSKFVGKDSAGNLQPVERIIYFKSQPSLHKCDARCLNAKGHNCECSCRGKNHGLGYAAS